MNKSQHWYDRDGKAVFEVPKELKVLRDFREDKVLKENRVFRDFRDFRDLPVL